MRTNTEVSVESAVTLNHRTALESANPDVLAEIYNPMHNIVIWNQQQEEALHTALDQLFIETPSLKLERDLSPATARDYLLNQLEGYTCAEILSSKIAGLIDMFCCLFDLNETGMRLTMLDRAMCPRFHVDRVPCRLVTTFQGAATQWLPHDVVDRTKLGHGGGGLPDEQSGIYRDSSDIRQLAAGDVALLKGELWEGNENAGLVHRSPKPRPSEKRLLLTLDFIG